MHKTLAEIEQDDPQIAADLRAIFRLFTDKMSTVNTLTKLSKIEIYNTLIALFDKQHITLEQDENGDGIKLVRVYDSADEREREIQNRLDIISGNASQIPQYK